MISLRVNKHFLASNETEESLKTRKHGFSCKTKVRRKTKRVTEMIKFNSPTHTVNPSRKTRNQLRGFAPRLRLRADRMITRQKARGA